MPNDELERILSEEREIQPSPMFAAKVMAAVQREAAAPPPIAFPWRRALPGFAGAAAVLGYAIAQTPADRTTVPIPAGWIDSAQHLGLGWMALAFALTGAALALTRRMVR